MKQCCKDSYERFKKSRTGVNSRSVLIDSIICPVCKVDYRQAGSESAMKVRTKRKRVYKPKRIRGAAQMG